ncbi:MAG: histidine phosphatase family protein [Chloroflexi bacterium]|nr:histidine phosphatase family protein [Chloroflexota bacterium]
MDLILIRHGQSQWNLDQTGGDDAPLTALGRAQARRAGLYCQAQFKISALYASTYQRARDTAQIINSFLNLEQVVLLDGLREFSEDYSFAMPRFASPLDALQLDAPVTPAAITPYYIAFQERVQRALAQVLTAHAHEFDTDAQIGIVAHGGTMGTILRTLAGSHHFSLNTENTGIHILRWREQRWHLIAINRVEHLECDRWQHEVGKDA